MTSRRATLETVPEPSAGRDTAAGVERLVLAHVNRGERIALLGEHSALECTIQQAGCTVRIISGSPAGLVEDLHEFAPQAIVAGDVLARAEDGASLLRAIVDAAPEARLLIIFHNESSADRLLSLLGGTRPSEAALPDDLFRKWLDDLNLSILHREEIDAAPSEMLFDGDLRERLRALFRQVNPAASSDRLFYVASKAAGAKPGVHPELSDGLLSVIMRNHRLDRLGLLDQAIFSIACQRYRPLEIVVATQSVEDGAVEALDQLLRKHQAVGGYSFRVVHDPSREDIRARLLNIGVEAARGRYVAFLDDDDVVYPNHYELLIRSLRAGTEVWAFARARRAFLTRLPWGELYCLSKRDVFDRDRYEFAELVKENFITLHSYVVDRARLGRFRLQFPETFTKLEDYNLLLRLAALHRPIFVGGAATCEYRIRDDGSNTVPESALPADVESVSRSWDVARLETDLVKQGVHTVMTLKELDRDPTRPLPQPSPFPESPLVLSAGPAELRYRIADKINDAIKLARPVHAALRGMAGLVLGRRRPHR